MPWPACCLAPAGRKMPAHHAGPWVGRLGNARCNLRAAVARRLARRSSSSSSGDSGQRSNKLLPLPADVIKLRTKSRQQRGRGMDESKQPHGTTVEFGTVPSESSADFTQRSRQLLGQRLVIMGPLSLVAAAYAEEYLLGARKVSGGIARACKWAFDGPHGALLRRQRYADLAESTGAAELQPLEAFDSSACIDCGGGPPSSLRRIGSWAVDCSALYAGREMLLLVASPLAKSLIPLLGPSCVVLAWGTRDLWLARWGMQSPGRFAVGQRLISLEAVTTGQPDAEIWASIKLNTAVAATFRVFLPLSCKSLNSTMKVVARANPGVALAVGIPLTVGMIGATAYCAFSPAWQLLCDPTGTLWMDRLARVQVLNS